MTEQIRADFVEKLTPYRLDLDGKSTEREPRRAATAWAHVLDQKWLADFGKLENFPHLQVLISFCLIPFCLIPSSTHFSLLAFYYEQSGRNNVLYNFPERGAWVAQLLSICLWLRSWSQCPGIEPASSSPTPSACVPSLTGCLSVKYINKIFLKK